MSASCPACQQSTLEQTTLAHGLPARQCAQCHGTLLSLLAYRDWRSQHAAPTDDSDDPGEAASIADSKLLLHCPECKGFMSKFRFSSEAGNQIDLCDRCDLVWLDRGEWQLVEHLARSGQLAKIFDAHWQQRLRAEAAKRRAEERWHAQLGEDYEKARELRSWLAQHPKGKELIAYLYLSQTEKS